MMANRARAFSFCGKIQPGKANIVAESCAREYVFVDVVPIFLEICSRVVVSPSFSETRGDV